MQDTGGSAHPKHQLSTTRQHAHAPLNRPTRDTPTPTGQRTTRRTEQRRNPTRPRTPSRTTLLAALLTLLAATGCAETTDSPTANHQTATTITNTTSTTPPPPTPDTPAHPPPSTDTTTPPATAHPPNPNPTNLDTAMANANLPAEQTACVQHLETTATLRELLDPATIPTSDAIAHWAPQLRACLDNNALARLALSRYATPTDNTIACASRHVASLSDTDLIALAAGDDTIRQQLAADCTAQLDAGAR